MAEVRAFGAKDGSMRTAAQTETALFWNANAVLHYQVALREQVTRRGLGIVESARAFAMLGTATADSLIACWRGKHDYAYWRPITAIRMADTDGNPRTLPDRAWTPLIPNPPYPDYPSGHACVTGAMTGTVAHLFGTSSLGLSVSSSVTGTSRSYDSTTALDRKTMDARIWLGIHFRRRWPTGTSSATTSPTGSHGTTSSRTTTTVTTTMTTGVSTADAPERDLLTPSGAVAGASRGPGGWAPAR